MNEKTHDHLFEDCVCGECNWEICMWCEYIQEKER